MVLILYVIAVSVVSCFHEPWFDELQAWQIAKCASIKDILFSIPHYEGHPPLWHLILLPFAKLGAPVNFSLAFVNIIFITAANALVIFKSPFPKIVRRLIPFSYYFFYQFGVISRPYSIVYLALMLAALTYNKRDEKPLAHILSLVLLCLSHAYGIILAGMLCVVWVIQIFISHIKSRKLSGIFKDKRCYELLGLAVFALALIAMIIPAEDVYYGSMTNDFIDRLKNIYYILMFPSDAFIEVFFGNYSGAYSPGIVMLILDCFIGIAVMVFLIFYAKKCNELATLLVPYIFFALFLILKYYSIYHIGILTAFFLFIIWICAQKDNFEFSIEIAKKYLSLIKSPILNKVIFTLGTVILISPVISSVYASTVDIKNLYGCS